MAPRRRMARRPLRKRTKVVGGRKRTVNKMSRQVHLFKRTAYLGNQTATISVAGAATPIAVAHSFSLSQLPNYSEFTALFDQYKITGAKLTYTPATTVGVSDPTVANAAVNGYSRIHSVIDYDDTNTPTSEDQLLEYGSHKSSPPFKVHTRYLKPKMLQEIYRSAISTAYAPRSNTFIDMSAPDVPHYGVKVWCSAPNTALGIQGSITYKVYLTLYFVCKNTR